MSIAYNKAKGSKWESDLVNHLREKFPAYSDSIHRTRLAGANDQGDVLATLPFNGQKRHIIIEAKNVAKFDLSTFIGEVTDEVENWVHAVNPTSPVTGVVVIKRKNRSVGQAYVVQTLDSFLEMVKDA